MDEHDVADLGELQVILASMSLAEIKRFCAGTLRAATTAQTVFRARFPQEYEKWNKDIEEDRGMDDGSSDR